MTTIKRIKCGDVNCFLVDNGEHAILVDTGRRKYRDRILAECMGKNVVMIVLTHGHIDHIANTAYLSKKLGAIIAMNQKDCKLIKNNLIEPLKTHTLLGKILLGITNKFFKNPKIEEFEPSIFLDNNYTFEDYNIDARIIELPGHTEGSIGILVAEKDFIVGDAMMNIVSPREALVYGNHINMIKSIELIRNSKAKRIHFGHGNSIKLERLQHKT